MATPPPAFSANYQTLAWLAFVSDVGASDTVTDRPSYIAQRTSEINAKVAAAPTPGWKTVWGPNFWWDSSSPATGGADNTWVVVFNPSFDLEDGLGPRPVYYTSIAGTNYPGSSYDVQTEDIVVGQVVDFNSFAKTWSSQSIAPPQPLSAGNDSIACIALGTASGAFPLVSVPFAAGSPAENITLPAFLQAAATAPDVEPTFVYGGHSLGGALTPVIALGMSMLISAKQYALPLAGPTAGNGVFAKQYTAAFPPVTTSKTAPQQLNVNYYNTLDVVPKAWARDSLKSIRGMYDIVHNIPLQIGVGSLIDNALYRSYTLSGITYTQIPSLTFNGTPLPPIPDKATLIQVIKEEHITDYLVYFGITGEFTPKELAALGRGVERAVTAALEVPPPSEKV